MLLTATFAGAQTDPLEHQLLFAPLCNTRSGDAKYRGRHALPRHRCMGSAPETQRWWNRSGLGLVMHQWFCSHRGRTCSVHSFSPCTLGNRRCMYCMSACTALHVFPTGSDSSHSARVWEHGSTLIMIAPHWPVMHWLMEIPENRSAFCLLGRFPQRHAC